MSNLVPAVEILSNRVVVSSRKVAEHFGKEHFNVVRDIRKVLEDVSEEFNQLNFEAVEYVDAKGESRPAYNLTKNGFVLLVMGYSGKEAMRMKEAYIQQFDAMTEELRKGKRISSLDDDFLPPNLPISNFQMNTIKDYAGMAGKTSGLGSAYFLARVYDHFSVAHLKDLTSGQGRHAVDLVKTLAVDIYRDRDQAENEKSFKSLMDQAKPKQRPKDERQDMIDRITKAGADYMATSLLLLHEVNGTPEQEREVIEAITRQTLQAISHVLRNQPKAAAKA